MKTLLLDRQTWDLCQDAENNIACASDPYSIAQDVASAVRTFAGEVYYDTNMGIPYWSDILSKTPPLGLLKARIIAAARTVPNVASASCYITAVTDREVKGQVQIVDDLGRTSAVSL